MNHSFSTLILLTCMFSAFAQKDFPKDYFQSPVDFPIYLSGTFGEPRSTHFHAGIDIKTQGVEGKDIKAAAGGYISRIKVSPWGYGNVLYITHPNGYTTVYGHLQSFKKEVAGWVKEKQMEKRSFEVDLIGLPATLFPVQQGEVVALSGNSGSSGGPHLHFEIRNAKEHILNPLHFGFDALVKDNVAPAVHNVVIYNQSEDKYFTTSKTESLIRNKEGSYSTKTEIVVNRPAIAVGIHSYDQMTGISNKNGVFSIRLLLDDSLMYHYEMTEFAFPEGRFVLSQTDYTMKQQYSRTIYKCFREPGNLISVCPTAINDGIIELQDTFEHTVQILVGDFHGNTTTTQFTVQYDSSSTFFIPEIPEYQRLLSYNQPNGFSDENISLRFPKGVLFDNLYFCYRKESAEDNTEIFCVHEQQTPLFTYYNLSIKPQSIDSSLTDKYLIAYTNEKNAMVSLGGTFDGEYVTTKTRTFGHFFITMDTISPVIKPINIYNGKKMTGIASVQFTITDNLSGIETYNAFLNDNWVILAYDGKRSMFTYAIDEYTLPGENELKIVASDSRGNQSIYTVNFTY